MINKWRLRVCVQREPFMYYDYILLYCVTERIMQRGNVKEPFRERLFKEHDVCVLVYH